MIIPLTKCDQKQTNRENKCRIYEIKPRIEWTDLAICGGYLLYNLPPVMENREFAQLVNSLIFAWDLCG